MISSTSSTVRTFAALLAGTALTLSALGCSGGGAADASGAKHPLLGAAAPETGAEAVSGEGPKTLKEAQGKVVILDFWGTFCDPCKKSFPKYQEIVEQFPGEVTVIAVAVDEPDSTKKEQLTAFAAENHAKFAIVWDKDHSAAEKYGMRSLTMPSSFIIDKTGIVRHVHVGFKDGEEAKVAEEVKALIGK
jgi:peroxiredoxin